MNTVTLTMEIDADTPEGAAKAFIAALLTADWSARGCEFMVNGMSVVITADEVEEAIAGTDE